jgi:hypothetical protein
MSRDIPPFQPVGDDAPRESQLRIFNETLGAVVRALRNRLDFESNFNAEIRTLSVDHDTEIELTLQEMIGPVLGVVILDAELAWTRVTANSIKLKVKWDSAPTTPVSTSFLLFGA